MLFVAARALVFIFQLLRAGSQKYDASAFDTPPTLHISKQDRESEEVLARIEKTEREFFSKSHRKQRYVYRSGYFPGLHKKKKLTISEAKADCEKVRSCAGFTYFAHSHSPKEQVWIDFTEETSGFVPDGKGYWHSYFKPRSMWHLPKPDQVIQGFYAYQAAILPPGNDLKGAVTTVGAAVKFCAKTKGCAGFQVEQRVRTCIRILAYTYIYVPACVRALMQVSLMGKGTKLGHHMPPDSMRAIIDYKKAITGFQRMSKLTMMYSYVKKTDAEFVAAAPPTPAPTLSPTPYPTAMPTNRHYVTRVTSPQHHHHTPQPHQTHKPITQKRQPSPAKGYTARFGYLPTGNNYRKLKMTLAKAVVWCRSRPSSKCAGFTFMRPSGFVSDGPGASRVYFDFKTTTKGFFPVGGARGVISGPKLEALSCAVGQSCKGGEWVTFLRTKTRGSSAAAAAGFALHLPTWLSKPSSNYNMQRGYLPPGNNFQPVAMMSAQKAELLCSGSKACAGFTFARPKAEHDIAVEIYFKTTTAGFVSAHDAPAAASWYAYMKKKPLAGR
jgi:hypothetical protein